MVDRIGPANAVAGAPSYDGRGERQLRGVHQAMGSTSRPLGARTGVRPGTPTTTVTATSTTWTCQPFAGEADVEAAAEAGSYPFAFDAVATGAMIPADGSNARIDILYVQIDDPAEGDSSTTPAVTRKYLAGTPGTGIAPSPPVARAFVIAQINVPKSGAGAPSVTWVAPYTAAAGGVIPVLTKAQLDAWTTAAPNQEAEVFGDTAALNGRYVFVSAGAGWARRGRLGYASNFVQTLLAGTPSWTDVCTITAVSAGKTCTVDWGAIYANGGSGANRTVDFQVLCDGVLVGAIFSHDSPLTPGATGYSAGLPVESAPAAGSHTWKLQARASAATACYAKFASMRVIEA